MHTPVRKAVIPVAGMGTRFLPATKAIPKELLPLIDKPIIQYIVEEAVAAGLTEIVFITSPNKTAIENHFDRNVELERLLEGKDKQAELEQITSINHLAQYVYIRQTEPLGLGHAVLQAKDVIGDEPFVVFGGDDIVQSDIPAAQQLIDVYQQYGGSVVGLVQVPAAQVERYGIADPKRQLADGLIELQDIVEKPALNQAPSRLAVGGRWLLTPEIFAELEQTQPGASGEIQLTDAIRSLLRTQSGYGVEFQGTYRDCGNKVEYIKTVIAFALKDPQIGPDIHHYIQRLLR